PRLFQRRARYWNLQISHPPSLPVPVPHPPLASIALGAVADGTWQSCPGSRYSTQDCGAHAPGNWPERQETRSALRWNPLEKGSSVLTLCRTASHFPAPPASPGRLLDVTVLSCRSTA